MVPDTEFSEALTKPLNVVQQIYADASDKSPTNITQLVETHFRRLFASPDASAKIPVLSPSNVDTLLSSSRDHAASLHRLVRFRAMIQDTGLGTEVFLAKHQHQERSITGLFGGDASLPASNEPTEQSDVDELNHQDLAERAVMYAVSVPGQSPWAAEAHREFVAAQASEDAADQLSIATAAVSITEPQSPQKIREVRERIRRAVEKGKQLGSAGK